MTSLPPFVAITRSPPPRGFWVVWLSYIVKSGRERSFSSPHFQRGSECKKQIDLCDLKFQVAPNDKRTDGYSVLINKCIKVVLINKLLSRFGQIRAVKLG